EGAPRRRAVLRRPLRRGSLRSSRARCAREGKRRTSTTRKAKRRSSDDGCSVVARAFGGPGENCGAFGAGFVHAFVGGGREAIEALPRGGAQLAAGGGSEEQRGSGTGERSEPEVREVLEGRGALSRETHAIEHVVQIHLCQRLRDFAARERRTDRHQETAGRHGSSLQAAPGLATRGPARVGRVQPESRCC